MSQPETKSAAQSAGASADQDVGQGFRWQGGDAAERAQAIDAAFDYRGNVTLHLDGGVDLECYLFNRAGRGDDRAVEVLPTAGGRERVPYARIAGITFTGKDTAAGKSWETWLRKWQAKKEAEARGEEVGSIDLVPEELD